MTTNRQTATLSAVDTLKYAAAFLKSRTDWACDSIAGSMCDHEHETELNAIADVVIEIRELAAQFGDLMRYSDGARVEQYAEIQPGFVTHHVWHPDPATEPPASWRDTLPSDPDVASAGLYEVSTDPVTHAIHVRVVRTI